MACFQARRLKTKMPSAARLALPRASMYVRQLSLAHEIDRGHALLTRGPSAPPGQHEMEHPPARRVAAELGSAAGGQPTNTPLATALGPASLVTRNCTWPVTVQLRYWPPWNEDTVRLSNTFPVDGSMTSIRSERLPLSHARPSARLTSTVKLVVEYHVAARRSAGMAAFCRARASLVEAAQVKLSWPETL